MKRLSLFVFFVCSFFISKAQFNTYHPFPDSNAYWSEESTRLAYCATIPVTPVTYFDYYLAGDTVMNGKTYHELNTSGGEEVCYACCGPEVIWQNYDYRIGYLREDTNRRIYYCPIGKSDTLLYDFNLKVGDTLPDTYNNDANTLNKNYIYSIDSILVGSTYRLQYIIANHSSSYTQVFDSITEGIGSALGLLEPIIPPFESGSSLICFSQNGSTVYPDSAGNCSRFYLSVPQINSSPLSLLVYPNPANRGVNITYQLPGQNNYALSLYNEMGQLVKVENINTNAGTMEEDVSSLSNGVYYYTLSINGTVEATNKLIVIH